MITTYLKDSNLIICPNYLKKDIINQINNFNKLISYKIMDLNTFKQNYFFSYDKKAIHYLMKKLNLKYEIILEYLDSMYYIENKNYIFSKLNKLNELKKELVENNLLTYNHFFQYYLNNTNIIIYGYDNIELFYKNIFSKFSNLNYITDSFPKKNHLVYEFNDIEDEIAYVCHNIKEKIDTGISIDKIKIVTPSSEYISPLKRIFSWCHIPLDIQDKTSLYDTEIGKNILKMINNNIELEEIIKSYQNNNIDIDIINQIITVFNEYIDFDVEIKELYSMIEYDLKHTFLPKPHSKNCVSFCKLEEVKKDEHIYLLGFNKENYPTLYKDDDFLSDNMKNQLNLFNSNLKNINSMNSLKNNLNRDTNLIITYKLKDSFNSYNPCLLVKEEEYNIIKNPKISFKISHLFNKLTLAKQYDNFYKYGTVSPELKTLKYNYPETNYRTYNNNFTGIDNKELISSLKNPFTLSYSTIDEFYRCGFRYYISNILKIKKDNIDEFYMNIGNIFHYVLSKCFENNFDFDTEWNKEASKYEFTLNKIILLEKLKQELKFDIEIITKHKKYSYFDQYLYEKRFTVPIQNTKKIPTNFVGIVDKISYLKENNKTLVSIIDYKTGSLPSNLNNIIYGIGMQLPIYLYFIKRSSLFPNLEVVGFYLQKIINKEMKATKGKTIEELKENALKLVGYSIDNEELLEKFDITYEDSQMINGLKKKKEGFYAYSKVLNNKQLENLDKLVSKKINEATEKILNGEFNINPKKVDKDIIGCEFCSYRDLCYKTEKNYIELEKHKDLDFLGGDDNA